MTYTLCVSDIHFTNYIKITPFVVTPYDFSCYLLYNHKYTFKRFIRNKN